MRNRSYITKLLKASSKNELYEIRLELEEKLRMGFNPEEAKEFVRELFNLVHDYKVLERDSEVLKRFAELIAEYIPASYFEKTL